MAKKTTSFRLEPETLKRLKIHAIHLGIPIGDTIKRFMDLAEAVRDAGNYALWTDYVLNDAREPGPREFIWDGLPRVLSF